MQLPSTRALTETLPRSVSVCCLLSGHSVSFIVTVAPLNVPPFGTGVFFWTWSVPPVAGVVLSVEAPELLPEPLKEPEPVSTLSLAVAGDEGGAGCPGGGCGSVWSTLISIDAIAMDQIPWAPGGPYVGPAKISSPFPASLRVPNETATQGKSQQLQDRQGARPHPSHSRCLAAPTR